MLIRNNCRFNYRTDHTMLHRISKMHRVEQFLIVLFATRNYWKRVEVYMTAPLSLHDITKTIVASHTAYRMMNELRVR